MQKVDNASHRMHQLQLAARAGGGENSDGRGLGVLATSKYSSSRAAMRNRGTGGLQGERARRRGIGHSAFWQAAWRDRGGSEAWTQAVGCHGIGLMGGLFR